MDSNNISKDHSVEVIIEGSNYALIPICAFHKVEAGDLIKRWDIIENTFGLRDTFATFNLYKIDDQKKWMLAKLKLEL
jgi:hypothetical protein